MRAVQATTRASRRHHVAVRDLVSAHFFDDIARIDFPLIEPGDILSAEPVIGGGQTFVWPKVFDAEKALAVVEARVDAVPSRSGHDPFDRSGRG